MAIIISPVNNPVTNTLYFQTVSESKPFIDETFEILTEDSGVIRETILAENGDYLEQEDAP